MRDDDQHTEDQYDEHMRRISEIRRSFDLGEISTSQKRRYIAEENMAYYKDANIRSLTTGEKLAALPRVANEVVGIVADTTGAPWEAAKVAVARRRELSRQAADAETVAESQRLREEAGEVFWRIIDRARPGGLHRRQEQLA